MPFDLESYIAGKLTYARAVNSGNGSEWTGKCPWCDAEPGRFYVNVENGRHLCNRCEARGKNAIPIVAQIEGMTVIEAQTYVFRESVSLKTRSEVLTIKDRLRAHGAEIEDDEEDDVDIDVPDGFVPCFKKQRKPKWRLPVYLRERKILSRTAKAWGLGYVNHGKMGGRLIIPIVCPNGRSWTGRAMDDAIKPKYYNPPGADHGRLLIGWNVAKLTGDLVLCEGPLDAVALYQHSVSAVGLGGKVLHGAQMAMLATLPASTAITIMLDSEEHEAQMKMANELMSHFKRVFIAKLPELKIDGKAIDPGNAPRKVIFDAIMNAEEVKDTKTMKLKRLVARLRKK